MSIFNLIEEIEIENDKLYNEKMYTESLNTLPEGELDFSFESIINDEGKVKEYFRRFIRLFKFSSISKINYDINILKNVNNLKVGTSDKKLKVSKDTLSLVFKLLENGKSADEMLNSSIKYNNLRLKTFNDFLYTSLPPAIFASTIGPGDKLKRYSDNSKIVLIFVGVLGLLFASFEYIDRVDFEKETNVILDILTSYIGIIAGDAAEVVKANDPNGTADYVELKQSTVQKLKDIANKLKQSETEQPYTANEEQQKEYAQLLVSNNQTLFVGANLLRDVASKTLIKKNAIAYNKFKERASHSDLTMDNARRLSELVDVMDILNGIIKSLSVIFGRIVDDCRTM